MSFAHLHLNSGHGFHPVVLEYVLVKPDDVLSLILSVLSPKEYVNCSLTH